MAATMIRPPLVLLSLIALLPAACTDDGGGEGSEDPTETSASATGETETAGETETTGEADEQDVSIQFAAVVGDEPAACGQAYDNIGSQGTSVEIQDLRFYVSGIELLDASGEATPLALTQDGLWQYEDVALVDFEDGTSICQDGGTAEVNTTVVGTVPAGDYVGVRFTLGVPFELNHQDVANAPSPLNVPSMFWVWQGGYKFARIDLRNGNPDDDAWFWHQGATGCMSGGPESPPEEPCLRSNRLTVELSNFDSQSQAIVLDLAAFLANVDVSQNTPMTSPGCMSKVDDPECVEVFPQLGLDLDSGECMSDCSDQQLFHVE